MLKTCFFILFVMFMRPAVSGPIMSHEKFVHLDYEEQKQIVIATMELVVEIESKYQREVKTSGFNSERFRRYTEFMKSVSSLMFPEAHAANGRNQRYGQYLNQLRVILNDKERNLCIYGGWTSEMVNGKCTHPRNSERFGKLYQSEANCSQGNNKITCNPAIFGFKNLNPAKMTLFCVDAGPNGADNTSRDCMAKALADKPEAGASSRELRIKNMIEGIKANPNDAKDVFNFLFKACACDSSKSPQISKIYSDYMRPHQTCYSILKMMSEFGPRCELKDGPLMDLNQTQFLKSIQGILEVSEYKSSNVKDLYRTKLSELRKNPEFKASEAAVCGGDPTGTVIADDPKDAETCVENRTPKNEFCCPEGEVQYKKENNQDACKPDEKNGITVNGTSTKPPLPKPGQPDGDGASTEDKCKKNPTDPTCTKPCAPPAEMKNGKCEPPEAVNCTPTEVKNQSTGKCDPKPPGDVCINGAINPSDCDKCPPEKNWNANDKKCEVKTVSSIACDPPVPDKELVGGECVPKCEGDTPHRNEATGVCEANKDTDSEDNADEEKSPITISLTGKDKDVNVTIVSVTISPEKTPKDGYKLLWFSRGTSRPRTLPGSKPKSKPTTVTIREDLPEPEAEGEEEVKPDTPAEKPDETGKLEENESDLKIDGWGPIDAPRQSNDYEMCARLIKDAKIVHEDCEKIPAKPGIAPRRNGPGQFGPQQFGPTRGGPSDAIFRGVR